MNIESLSYITDLIFLRFEGKITDRGEYVPIETPSNPGFVWGNILPFLRPPTRENHSAWENLFYRDFEHSPLVKPMTFEWDGTDG